MNYEWTKDLFGRSTQQFANDPAAMLDYSRTSLAEQQRAIQSMQNEYWTSKSSNEINQVLHKIDDQIASGNRLSTEMRGMSSDLNQLIQNGEEMMQNGIIAPHHTANYRNLLDEAKNHPTQRWSEPSETNSILENTGADGMLMDMNAEQQLLSNEFRANFWTARQERIMEETEGIEMQEFGLGD